ncbi:hypothetical protein B296_00034670 [Ensete ventricosum]|uniref:Uncharacterized protein n=1 Tax=Ensete ventricosum TaxID=4639 RepID=A0A426X9F8_ENSVE|nr:hypothetical protein B296_00034670 [Ensete ventricosum]
MCLFLIADGRPTAENFVPIRLDLDIDGQRFKDAFTWNPSAAHEEHDSEQDEREVGYSPRAEEAQSDAPTGKRSHKERLSTVETASMFLMRPWRNSTKAKEGSLG